MIELLKRHDFNKAKSVHGDHSRIFPRVETSPTLGEVPF